MKKCEQFLKVHKVESLLQFNYSFSPLVSLTDQLLFKVQETKSLNLFGGFTTLVRVHFVGVAGTGSGEISERGSGETTVTGSVEICGSGSGRVGLFPFRTGGAATDCSLVTSDGTFETTDCSLGLRKCLFRRIVSFPVFTKYDLSDS